MFAYTATALRDLAQTYIRATKMRATRLGLLIAGNDHLITRILDEKDCLTESALRASDWFDSNWPDDLPWPRTVRRRPLYAMYASRINGTVRDQQAPKIRRPQTDPPPRPPRAPRLRKIAANAR
jgi:hypothetical protein